MINYFKKQALYLIIVILYRFNKTSVYEEKNISGLDSFIIVTWHGKALGLMEYLRGRGYYALVSQSRDGSLIVEVAKKFGYKFFRGSSNRGGKKALQEMGVFFDSNKNGKIVITPDGPTGPEHQAKPGAFILSQQSGRPIIPIIADVKSSWKFKNWHTFYLSKPFSKTRVVFGEPLYFSKNDSIKTGTKKIEDALNRIDEVACNHE